MQKFKHMAKWTIQLFVDLFVLVISVGAAAVVHWKYWGAATIDIQTDGLYGWLTRNWSTWPGYTGWTVIYFLASLFIPFLVIAFIRYRRTVKTQADLQSEAFTSLGRMASEWSQTAKNMDKTLNTKLGDFQKSIQYELHEMRGVVETVKSEHDKNLLALTNSVSSIENSVKSLGAKVETFETAKPAQEKPQPPQEPEKEPEA